MRVSLPYWLTISIICSTPMKKATYVCIISITIVPMLTSAYYDVVSNSSCPRNSKKFQTTCVVLILLTERLLLCRNSFIRFI